jgi:hypothetical protein
MKLIFTLLIALSGLSITAQDFIATPLTNNVLFLGVEYTMDLSLEPKEKIISVNSSDYFKVVYEDQVLKVTPTKEGKSRFIINTNKRNKVLSNTFVLSNFPDPKLMLDRKLASGNQVTMMVNQSKRLTLESAINYFDYKFNIHAYVIQKLDENAKIIQEFKKKGAGLNDKAGELVRSIQKRQSLKIRAKLIAPTGDVRYVELLIDAI